LTESHDALRPSDLGLLQQKISRATDMAFRLQEQNREFFNVLTEFAALEREGQPQSNYSWQARVLPSTRTLPHWSEVEIQWDETGGTMNLLLNGIAEIHKAASDIYADGHDNLEDVIGDIGNVYRRLNEAYNNMTGMISEPNQGLVYWIEINPRGERLSLNAAPLRVGPMIEESLWHQKTSVILTSATLTAHGEFQYLRNTLGADEADEMQLGSPFDYESSTLLYVSNDIPEPNASGYQQMLDRSLIATAKATGGRMLVLFTSYTALKKTAQAITAPLAAEDILSTNRAMALRRMPCLNRSKSTERAVLLGTRSFWEGVDVPGNALSWWSSRNCPSTCPATP